MEWRPLPHPFAELATALEAVAFYRENVHVDVDVVEVVFTPPGKPSRLSDALRTRGWIESDLEHTEPSCLQRPVRRHQPRSPPVLALVAEFLPEPGQW